jgi:hypothetical protein
VGRTGESTKLSVRFPETVKRFDPVRFDLAAGRGKPESRRIVPVANVRHIRFDPAGPGEAVVGGFGVRIGVSVHTVEGMATEHSMEAGKHSNARMTSILTKSSTQGATNERKCTASSGIGGPLDEVSETGSFAAR